MSIRYVDDLYPRTDPRDGARIGRFSKLQLAHFEAQRNGTGAGKIGLRGTTADAALIDPLGLQYVRKVRINTAVVDGATLSGFDEAVVGGYFFEEGDFLALDRPRRRLLTFGGAGTLSYLDREMMWSHTYETWGNDPVEGGQPDTWLLHNQSTIFAGGDYLGAILWRIVHEGLGYVNGPGYLARTALDDDKTESAIPFVVLTFDGFTDSSGNPWTIPSGEFTAQVGDSLLSVTKRLMEAGLYVEMDPDTFELRAWEVANHGRDRTGLAWGADVIRFEPPADQIADNGNILSDLKRAIRAIIRRTSILSGGQDVYGKATIAGDVPWHGFYPSDVSDTDALEALSSRQLGARNDAGDTVQVRIKVGNDPANGRYLPGEHILPDDLGTLHTGTDPWDWDESSYPVAAWSITSRRSGAPDAFVHLGAMYHATTDRQFQAGSGVGKHTHGPNPRLCDPTVPGTEATVIDGPYTWDGGTQDVAAFPSISQAAFTMDNGHLNGPNEYYRTQASGGHCPIDGLNARFWPCTAGATVGVSGRFRERSGNSANTVTLVMRYWDASGVVIPGEDHTILTGTGYGAMTTVAATDTAPTGAVKYAIVSTAGAFIWDDILPTTGTGTEAENPHAGTSSRAARCDHEHDAEEHEHPEYAPVDHGHLLVELNDVDVSTPPTDGQVLVYDDTTETWIPDTPSGSGVSDLDDLTDVDLTTDPPNDEEVLTYEASSSLWVPKPAPSGGGSLTQAYAGYNTVGGSTETLTSRRWLLKKVTLANDCMLTDVEAYVSQITEGASRAFSVALFSDIAGAPGLLLTVNINPVTTVALDAINGAGGITTPRWLGAPIGRWCAAGDYWIAWCMLDTNSGAWQIYKDGSGGDRHYTSGGNLITDAGFNTITTTTDTYSIRANTIR